MAEKTYAEESLGRKTSEGQIEKVDEAHEEANFLRHIKEWEGLTYDEAYQKMQVIFGGLEKDYGSFKNAFNKFSPGVVRELAQPIEESLKSKEPPIRILVTGLGVSGKSTVMGTLVQELARQYSSKKWTVLGVNRDFYDQKELPPCEVCVVENVNAFTGIPDPWQGELEQIDSEDKRDLKRREYRELLDEELEGFDLVVYTNPSPKDYNRYWQERVGAWEERGWLTEEGPRSRAEAEKAIRNRERWLEEDRNHLRKLEEKGKAVIEVDPDSILREFFRVIKE